MRASLCDHLDCSRTSAPTQEEKRNREKYQRTGEVDDQKVCQ